MSVRHVKIIFHIYPAHTAVSVSAGLTAGKDVSVWRVGALDLPLGSDGFPDVDQRALTRLLIRELRTLLD